RTQKEGVAGGGEGRHGQRQKRQRREQREKLFHCSLLSAAHGPPRDDSISFLRHHLQRAFQSGDEGVGGDRARGFRGRCGAETAAEAALMLISPSPGVSPAVSPFQDTRLSGGLKGRAAAMKLRRVPV